MRDGHYEGQAVRRGGTGSSSLWSRQLLLVEQAAPQKRLFIENVQMCKLRE